MDLNFYFVLAIKNFKGTVLLKWEKVRYVFIFLTGSYIIIKPV